MANRKAKREKKRQGKHPYRLICGIRVYWYIDTAYSNQYISKLQIEVVVAFKAPEGTTDAWILNGWHESPSDREDHATVNYLVFGEWTIEHVYP